MNIVLVSIAIIHKFAQRARLQTSHIYILAGFTLNHKNATKAQVIVIQRADNKNIH